MLSPWRLYRLFLAKDLRLEARGRETLAPLVTMALLVALIANVGFDGLLAPAAVVMGATLWVAVAFAAQVGLARSFVVEAEQGTLAGWQATNIDLRPFFFAKATGHLVTIGITTLGTAIAAGLFFGLPLDTVDWGVAIVLLLGAVGVTLATTLAAAIAMHGRHWILLVPLLALPAMFPLIATGVPATVAMLAGADLVDVDAQLRVLLAYDLVLVVTAWALVPPLFEP